MHCYAHGISCQSKFNPGLLFGIGSEGGEICETNHSILSSKISNTVRMTAENRHLELHNIIESMNNKNVLNFVPKIEAKFNKALELLKDLRCSNPNNEEPGSYFELEKEFRALRKKLCTSGSNPEIILDEIRFMIAQITKLELMISRKEGTI